MLLTIIIPAYNVAPFISECLESIVGEKRENFNFEIIVVDDGSTDDTLKVVRKYQDLHTEIKMFSQVNAGVGAARNKGVEMAKGKYLYFLDPDDLVHGAALFEAVNIANARNLEILAFHSHQFFSDSKNIPICLFESSVTKVEEFSDGYEYISSYKYKNEVWWFVVKNEVFKRGSLKFIVGRWMEDAILTTQLFLASKSFGLLPRVIHFHRNWPKSAMNDKSDRHYQRVIYDNAHAAVVFNDIITNLDKENKSYEKVRQRIKTRQHSFSFFLLIRFVKSQIPMKNLPSLLGELRQVEAYPVTHFIGEDYSNFSYKLLIPIINQPWLLNLFASIFRGLNGMRS